MSERAYVETWKGIAARVGRSERWCRYMAARAERPLPVGGIGGVARLYLDDLEAWERAEFAAGRGGGARAVCAPVGVDHSASSQIAQKRRTNRCSRCLETGHNVQTCPKRRRGAA